MFLYVSLLSSLRKQPRKREEKRELLPPLLSPLSDEPPIRQRRTSECSSFSQEGGASSATSTLLLPTLSCSLPHFSSSSSSSSHKHRSKGESKSFSRSKTSSVSRGKLIMMKLAKMYTVVVLGHYYTVLSNII